MNLDKLQDAQASFLARYPDGFADASMQAVRSKHNVDKLVQFTQAALTREQCQRPQYVADTLVTIISRSSMVSRFEKPPFKRFVDGLDSDGKELLARALEHRLYDRKGAGFESFVDMLKPHKLAKWAVVSAVPFYFAPRREVFVKPTTVKRIIKALEVPDLQYHATPSWAFYRGYQALMRDVKKEVSPSLAPNYAALSGFLMMTL
ncbi:MAG: hypothetical protein AAF458_06610 [Pseudomonadota bacterium]